MFKFLKSKKGFTLVELMIVVVIMAILVAVAVPIYSAVTKNAKKKTCIANMREISAQINNNAMAAGKNLSGSFTITSNGSEATMGTNTLKFAGETATIDVQGMFQVLPYCPAGGTYTVKVSPNSNSEAAGSVNVQIKCDVPAGATDFDEDDIEGHVYGTFTEDVPDETPAG